MAETPQRHNFSARPAAPLPSANAGASSSALPLGKSSDNMARYTRLEAQGEELRRLVERGQFQYEQAANDLRACEAEGQALGVRSLDELLAMIERETQADAQRLDERERLINEHLSAMQRINRELEALNT